jgi:hypothetical protein
MDNIRKDMTLGVPTLPIKKILAYNPIDRYKKIGTICIKDPCLRILPGAARGLQSRCHGNSPAAHSLRDDQQAGNNNTTRINQNRIVNEGILII